MNTVVSNIGLGMYVASILIGGLLLSFDLYLLLSGQHTITDWVTKCHETWRFYVIVGATSLGLLGMILHFVFYK